MEYLRALNSIIDEIEQKGCYYRNGTVGTVLNTDNSNAILRELKLKGYSVKHRQNGYCNYWGMDILIEKQKEIDFNS